MKDLPSGPRKAEPRGVLEASQELTAEPSSPRAWPPAATEELSPAGL